MKQLFKNAAIAITAMFVFMDASAAIQLQFPNSNGTGTLSDGTVYQCRNTPESDFAVTVQVKSPYTSAGSTELSYEIWWGGAKVETQYAGFIANDGVFHDISWRIAANTMMAGGMYKIVAVWGPTGSQVTEVSQEYYILTQHVALTIEGSDADGTVVLAPCTPNVYAKGAGFTCPGSIVDYTLSVQEVDITTYNPVGPVITRVLTSSEVFALQGGSFSLKTFCTTGVGGTTLSFINKRRYRVQLIMSGSGIWRQRTKHFMYKTVNYDLVIKDHYAYKPLGYNLWGKDDEGAEENRMGYNLYQSPDVWNQLTTTGGGVVTTMGDIPGETRHVQPDYSVVQNTNYMFTKVNNIGCAQSPPVNLRMFWTRARLGEVWSDHWLYDLNNNYTIDGSGVRRPLGSEITISGATQTNPYNTNTSPVIVPSISSASNADAYIINPKSWFVPNPNWYNINNGSMSGQSKPVICLLSRLQEKNSPIDPIIWEPASPVNIDPYLSQNNNVATRNTTLLSDPQTIIDDGMAVNGVATTEFHTVIANSSSVYPTRICLRNISASTDYDISEFGEIQIGFTNDIWSNWMANGMAGSGFQVIAPTLVRITNAEEACFENITVGNAMNAQLGVRVAWDANATYPADYPTFRYALQQENMSGFSNYHGSDVIFMMPARGPVPAMGVTVLSSTSTNTMSTKSLNKKYYSERSAQSEQENAASEFGMLLFPNPASSVAVLTFTGISTQDNLSVQMKDITGKVVLSDIAVSITGNGGAARINLDEFANGVYYVTVLHNGNQTVEKLVIQK